jgi:cell division septation protein DedD
MDKFVIDLVKRDGSAILPDFGALSVVDESTGELMFNEYLKFNDGKLVQLIVEHSSMDEQDAQNAVAKYIREIKVEIDKGESYGIFGAGSFSKDVDGAIVFSGSLFGSTQKEDIILGPSPTPTATADPVIISTEGANEASTEIAASVQEDPAVVAVSTDTPPPTEPQKAHSQQPTEQSTSKKKGGLFYALLLLLVMVGVGGTFVGLNYDEVKAYFGWDQFDVVQPISQLAEKEDIDSFSTDEPAEEAHFEGNQDLYIEEDFPEEENKAVNIEPIPMEKVEFSPTTPASLDESVVNTGNHFHLIGGSFTDKGNAENFVRDMQSKGYASHIVGEFNGMHMVSVKSFATRESAMNELSAVQNDAPKAWLFNYPK